jgi:hypothetical protein
LKSVAIPTDLGKFKCLGKPIFILKILILWLYNIYEFIFIAFAFEFGPKRWRNGLPHGLISQISRVEFVRRTGTSKNMLVVS